MVPQSQILGKALRYSIKVGQLIAIPFSALPSFPPLQALLERGGCGGEEQLCEGFGVVLRKQVPE